MAEKEYIEREEIIKRIKLRIDDYSRDCNSFAPKMVLAYKEFLYMVEHLPAADVQEVRHGENVTPFHPADEFICSECGIAFKEISEYIIEDDVYREFYFKFCPNCGAKMDKE